MVCYVFKFAISICILYVYKYMHTDSCLPQKQLFNRFRNFRVGLNRLSPGSSWICSTHNRIRLTAFVS